MFALREERANPGNSTEVGEDALALLAVPLADLVVVMTDAGRSPSLVGRSALTQLNLKQGEVWKGEGQNVSPKISELFEGGERRTRWWSCCISVLHHLDRLCGFGSLC